jgi:inosine-uridine nucleoside N-ribohydrolase
MNMPSMTLATAALVLLPAFALADGSAKPKIPIILDCDIGTDIDDTFALTLAIASPELDLRGVTTVSGDTRTRALMVCRILTAAGRREVPVAAGAEPQPPQELRGMQVQYARHPAVVFNRTAKPIKEGAVAFLYQKLKAEPGAITLVAVGPLTNIARLITEHPDCKPWIKRLVLMGGAVRVGYNNKPPAQPEFNIRADIKAAQTVFTSGIPLVVAPLDATTMLKLEAPERQRLWDAGTLLAYNVQSLYQLWDQKQAPVLYDPVAVTLCFEERFCKMEDLRLEVDDKGLTREVKGKPNARVATAIDKDAFLNWVVERLGSYGPKVPAPKGPLNVSTLIPRGGFPNRVHAFEDFETDIEKRWWMSGKLETAKVPPGSKRACRGVLTQDFDDRMGEMKTMYTAVIFNPVPGPPMGKNPRLSFRYWLKGTDTLRIQIYSLTNGYHRCLTLTKLAQGQWQEGTVDMTAVRRPDGGGGPLSENERIDDIQFYTDPKAELLIDDIVLYDAAGPQEKRPFPRRILFTGWFDTGKQGKEWPGSFDIVEIEKPLNKAARSVVNPKLDQPWIQLGLRGDRPLGGKPQLFFRYRLTGAERMRVLLVNRAKNTQVELKNLKKGEWAEATVDFSGETHRDRVDEVQFVLPKGAELLLDDVLLYEPAAER